MDRQHIRARTADGRAVTLDGDAVDAEHLDHAYALTVHRAQGATYDRAHVLARGGGRELAYVSMSRARDRSTVHATADDLAQAVAHLQADWDLERHQRWITHTSAVPGRDPDPGLDSAVSKRVRAALQDRILGSRQGDSSVHAAQVRLSARARDLAHLRAGQGRWRDTPEGEAARNLADTRRQLEHAKRQLASPGLRRRDRRAVARSVEQWEAAVTAAERRWQTIGEPRLDELKEAVGGAEQDLARCRTEDLQRRLTLGYHTLERDAPEHAIERRTVAERLAHLEIEGPGIELGR